MADPPNYGNPDRDVEQALLALKKGSHLIKYSRKGKPKLCPFRISSDETTLIWLSRNKERSIKLASVTRIIPGQRTAVFKRFLRPEKDYLSFSLIYNNGERSLDLICKDQAEAEVWFAGLNALVPSGPRKHSKADGSDRLSCSSDGDFGRPYPSSLDSSSSISRNSCTNSFLNRDPSLYIPKSDAVPDHANMLRVSNGDVSRVSVSSAPSNSSQGSGPDDIESLGDIYIWGEVWCDGISPDGTINSSCLKIDASIPRPLETHIVLDVHQIACGFRHAALVNRQGEVFTWGDALNGRLGHGVDKDTSRPKLVDTVTGSNVEMIACGEFHTCAISTAGDLFTWGDGTYSTGLLCHGTSSVSHWIPKRVSGSLEGVQVLSVACGTWHTALTTLNGKVFTSGDGTFGVLGHGDRESVSQPKEVESLSGLRTVKVACGTWHTAAIVEVLGQSGVNVISRKLFTWGDGDKYRLGHGDKDPRLVPTCVPSLIDYNFHQLACGHTMTVALTTSGHVMTWGSTNYGQLGNPQSDGKLPCVVQDRLMGELIEEIACGAYHVTVLTSRSEVYTWGRGANGRLGHGDAEDKSTPTLVEAFKDRHVKSISCGSNFSACICIHKWVSGADQSACSGCRQPFGYTRKRHNCNNCGLVHCHACSSRKSCKAALAPTPSKPHRVCDSCFVKIKSAESTGGNLNVSRRNVAMRQSIDIRDKSDRGDSRFSRLLFSVKLGENNGKVDSCSQSLSLKRLKDISFPSSLKTMSASTPPLPPSNANNFRASSPYARKSVAPSVFSGSILDSLRMSNESLDKEIIKLQAQVKNLKQKCEAQDMALKKSEKKAMEESTKSTNVAKFIRTIEEQLKEVSEKAPEDIGNSLKTIITQADSLLKEKGYIESNGEGSGSNHVNTNTDDNNKPVKYSRHHRVQSELINTRMDAAGTQSMENNNASRNGVETIEQFEHGVYVTFLLTPDGNKYFKRVRFSKRRFAEQQAEEWWKANQDRVYGKYPPR